MFNSTVLNQFECNKLGDVQRLGDAMTISTTKSADSNFREENALEPRLFNKTDFWVQFSADLHAAEESIFLYVPYIRRIRVESALSIFEKIQKHVEVTVVTHDPETQIAYQCLAPIQWLSNLGWKFKYWPIFHEKVAIVDRKIAWAGSLNILSHGESSDLMHRFMDRTSVCDIIQHVESQILSRANHSPIRLPLTKEQFTCPICGATNTYEDRDVKSILTCAKYPDCPYRVFIRTDNTSSAWIVEDLTDQCETQDPFAS